MADRRASSGLSRRGFLAGMAAGAMVAARPAAAKGPARKPARLPRARLAFRVGVLLPGSTIRPTLGTSLLAGMQVGLDVVGGRHPWIELIPADTGIGPARTFQEAHRLIEEHDVAVLAGIATPATAARLNGVLQERRTLLVVSDAGADAIEPVSGGGPIFYDSLAYWQASWAMGMWAARNLGRRALVAASFYESGYDALHAFQCGLEEGGGEVVRTCVTHVPPAMHDAGRVLAAVRETRPDFVFALYGGQSALDFVEAYAGSGLARRVPLVGSSFLADETLLRAMGRAALGVRSCLSWAPDLPTAANRTFTAAYHRATGEQPDAFAVLGYDAARMIAAAMAGAARDGDRLNGLGDALKAAVLESPRGRITVDTATQLTRAPLYLREVRSRNGAIGNEVVAELPPLPDPAHSMAALRSGTKSGWLNEYPSA